MRASASLTGWEKKQKKKPRIFHRMVLQRQKFDQEKQHFYILYNNTEISHLSSKRDIH